MFEHISGILSGKSPFFAVVECGGVGYMLSITVSTYELLPDEGEQVKLLTHLVHRDDDMELYGFATSDERELFRKLLSVTRVGPKLALAILSGISARKLAAAIASGDVKTIAKVPKVGKKTAERIILELRGKMDVFAEQVFEDEVVSDAVAALVSLGFSKTEALQAIAKARKDEPEASVDQLIKVSLSNR